MKSKKQLLVVIIVVLAISGLLEFRAAVAEASITAQAAGLLLASM